MRQGWRPDIVRRSLVQNGMIPAGLTHYLIHAMLSYVLNLIFIYLRDPKAFDKNV